jgi:hypothetical protein
MTMIFSGIAIVADSKSLRWGSIGSDSRSKYVSTGVTPAMTLTQAGAGSDYGIAYTENPSEGILIYDLPRETTPIRNTFDGPPWRVPRKGRSEQFGTDEQASTLSLAAKRSENRKVF